MARTTLTRNEALRRARERSAARLHLEQALVGLTADWEQANDQLDHTYAAMYRLGLTRADIARRLDIPTTRVPRREDLPVDEEPGDTDSDDGEHGATVDDTDDEAMDSDGPDDTTDRSDNHTERDQ